MSTWWKERSKRPKTGSKYHAIIPDLINKNNNKQNGVIFEDVPIPIEYFELQHFYSWYQENFDYQQYVKQKRNEYEIQLKKQQEEMNKFLANQSKFRRSQRFKEKAMNYKEYSPQIIETESDTDFDDFFDSTSDENNNQSDEEYTIPQFYKHSKKKNKTTKKQKKNEKKTNNKNKNKIIGKKRKLKDIVDLTNESNKNKNKNKKRKLSSSKKKKSKISIPPLNPNIVSTTNNYQEIESSPLISYGFSNLPIQSSSSGGTKIMDEWDFEMQIKNKI